MSSVPNGTSTSSDARLLPSGTYVLIRALNGDPSYPGKYAPVIANGSNVISVSLCCAKSRGIIKPAVTRCRVEPPVALLVETVRRSMAMAKRMIILAAVAAAALSSAPAAPFALARAELQTVAYGSRYFPEDAILAWSGERFTITRIDFLDRFSTERESIEAWMQGNEDLIDALQAAVRSNPELLAALRARSVQINNIGAAQVAMNGNLVFYLR